MSTTHAFMVAAVVGATSLSMLLGPADRTIGPKVQSRLASWLGLVSDLRLSWRPACFPAVMAEERVGRLTSSGPVKSQP